MTSRSAGALKWGICNITSKLAWKTLENMMMSLVGLSSNFNSTIFLLLRGNKDCFLINFTAWSTLKTDLSWEILWIILIILSNGMVTTYLQTTYSCIKGLPNMENIMSRSSLIHLHVLMPKIMGRSSSSIQKTTSVRPKSTSWEKISNSMSFQ